MFFDFSSAINTIQSNVICDKLVTFNIAPTIILWILEYLTARPQCVKLSSTLSSNTITTTAIPEAPQVVVVVVIVVVIVVVVVEVVVLLLETFSTRTVSHYAFVKIGKAD
ncbi:reverse transcriptase-like protein [Elysia marginata]|uniref:Reverse transcriptase-like protein n=1 Tax=Elysia marginata TaxID=1093978 RepID=A0AAV4GKM6_9GAST|nr:reverse transcriptase-like protein [Elysia marginata]